MPPWNVILWASDPAPGRVLTETEPHATRQQAAGIYAAALLCSMERLAGIFDVEQGHYLILAIEDLTTAVERPDLEAEVGEWQWMDQGSGAMSRRIANLVEGLPAGPTLLMLPNAPDFPINPIAALLDQPPGDDRIAMGPTTSGGFWCIAWPTTPHPVILDQIDWTAKNVYDQLLVNAGIAGLDVDSLTTWPALRTFRDVELLLDRLADTQDSPAARLSRRVRQILGLS